MSAKFCRQCGVPLLVLSDDGLCEECRKLQQNPDGLSKMTKLGGVPFKDMKHLDEDDRVKEMVKIMTENPTKVIGLMVETTPDHKGKGDRYIKKVRSFLPTVQIVSRRNGPVAGVETISFKAGPSCSKCGERIKETVFKSQTGQPLCGVCEDEGRNGG